MLDEEIRYYFMYGKPDSEPDSEEIHPFFLIDGHSGDDTIHKRYLADNDKELINYTYTRYVFQFGTPPKNVVPWFNILDMECILKVNNSPETFRFSGKITIIPFQRYIDAIAMSKEDTGRVTFLSPNKLAEELDSRFKQVHQIITNLTRNNGIGLSGVCWDITPTRLF